MRRIGWLTLVLGACVLLTGCTADTFVKKMSGSGAGTNPALFIGLRSDTGLIVQLQNVNVQGEGDVEGVRPGPTEPVQPGDGS